MSTNNQKNRHLSHMVAALNVAPVTEEKQKKVTPTVSDTPLSSLNQQRQAKPPLSATPEQKIAFSHTKQQNSNVQAIIIFLLVLTLGSVGTATYWLNTKLHRLENIYTPQQASVAEQPPLNTEDIKQLQERLTELEQRVKAETEMLANDHSTITDGLAGLKQAIAKIPSTNRTAAPSPKAVEKVTPPVKKRISTQQPKQSWFVNLGTFYTQEAAGPLLKRAKQLGLQPKLKTANLGGKLGYRIQITDISDRNAAEQLAQSLEGKLRLNGLWVGRE